jgi:stage III sporulation protein AB
MNIILGFFIMIICTFFGYKFSLKYSGRSNFYESFCRFNKIIQTEVKFKQSTLNEILTNIKDKDDFYSLLKDCVINEVFSIKAFEEKINKIKYLSKEDVDFFNVYINNLGTSDLATQSKFLEGADKMLLERNAQAKKDEKKYKTLCLKIGFLIGLTIFIIIL